MTNDRLGEMLSMLSDNASWLRGSAANMRPISIAVLMGVTAFACTVASDSAGGLLQAGSAQVRFWGRRGPPIMAQLMPL